MMNVHKEIEKIQRTTAKRKHKTILSELTWLDTKDKLLSLQE